MGRYVSTIAPSESAGHNQASVGTLSSVRDPVKGGVTEAGIVSRRSSPLGKRALFRRSSLSAQSRHTYSILLLSIVLVIEGLVVLVVIQDLRNSYGGVVEIYERSLRGLWEMGELQYEAQETRRATMYALTTKNANLQVDYADQSREAELHVTRGIADFVARAQMSEGRSIGHQLTNDWTRYLAVRDQVLALILEGRIRDAVDLDIQSGAPQFERVRQDLEEVKGLYDAHASQRLAAVAAFSERSVIKLSSALGIGLLFGSIAVWLIQRSTVRAALQLASLQMDIVASVSHELRTPITAILSAGENFRDGLVEGEDSLKKHGVIITKQARQLKSLVDQVLVYATAMKDKPWHDVRLLDIGDLIDDALSKVSPQLREAGFIVDREIETDLPPVAGDISLLSHCLQNLIANAVKYSGQNRWVGISADLVGTGGSNEVQIRVHDHGLGIAAADLAHVFEPFYRGRRAAEAQIRGSGLGLSIARRCAEVFGGRLTVVSAEGVGSTFTLHLPSAREPALVSETNKTNGRAQS